MTIVAFFLVNSLLSFNHWLLKGSGGDEKKKRTIRDEDKWKHVPPADGEAHTKVGPNGKTYHWCLNHLMWCIHTTEQFNKNPSEPPPKTPTTKVFLTTKRYSTCLTLDDVLTSIGEEE